MKEHKCDYEQLRHLLGASSLASRDMYTYMGVLGSMRLIQCRERMNGAWYGNSIQNGSEMRV